MTPEQTRLIDIVDQWISLVKPAVQRDPTAFQASVGLTPDGFRAKLVDYVLGKSISTATALVTNNLEAATGWVNDIFQTTISRGPDGFYTATPTLNSVTPTMAVTPTVQQVAEFGSGVDLATLDPATVEAAAQLKPDSYAAQYLQEPDPSPAEILPASGPMPLPEGAPAPAVTAPIATNYPTTVAAKIAPPQTTDEPMAANMIDPTYASTYSTYLPSSSIQASVGSDILGGLAAGLGSLAGGAPIGTALLGGLQAGGVLPTGSTPGIAGPTGGDGQTQDSNLLNQLLGILGSIPGGQVPAAVIGGAQKLLGNGTQTSVTIPAGGGASLQTQVAPVVNATQTTTYRAPKGYVVVTINGSNGVPVKVAMLKPLAKYYKLWSPRRKPPISAAQWRGLQAAERTKKKAKTIAMKAGYTCRLK